MNDSSLLLTLRLMDNSDLERLKILAETGFYSPKNRGNDAQLLLEYLYNLAPDFADEAAVSGDFVAQSLFGHRSKPQEELRKAMSALLDLAQKILFLKSIHFFQPPSRAVSPDSLLADLRQKVGLLRQFSDASKTQSGRPNDQKNDKLILRTYKQILQYWNLLTAPDPQTNSPIRRFSTVQLHELIYLYLLAETQYYFYNLHNRAVNSKVTEDLIRLADIHAAVFEMISIEHAAIYQMSSTIRNPFREQPKPKKYGEQFLSRIENAKLVSPENRLPSVQLFDLALRLYRPDNGDDQAYEVLLELVGNDSIPMGRDQHENFKSMLLTYNSWRYKLTGQKRYLEQYAQLQTRFIEDAIRENNNRLSAVKFLANIANALALDSKAQLDWVKQLLTRFENGVNLNNTTQPQLVFQVCKALVLYHEKNYEDAFRVLGSYKDYGRIDEEQCLSMAIRLDFKLRYELEKYFEDDCVKAIAANEQRIRRLHDVSQNLARQMLLFVNHLKTLYAFKASCSLRKMIKAEKQSISKKLDAFIQKINSAPEFPDRYWVVQKSRELKDRLQNA